MPKIKNYHQSIKLQDIDFPLKNTVFYFFTVNIMGNIRLFVEQSIIYCLLG